MVTSLPKPKATIALKADKVTFSVGGRKILSGVSLEVAAGEFISIVGPSGSGKSTLLKILAGLLKTTSGEVWVGGEKISAPAATRHLMFQEATLLPWLNVAQNVEFALKIAKPHLRAKERYVLTQEALITAGLTGRAFSRIEELSGGEQKRVALARALVLQPEILLLDEPFSALDVISKEILQHDLRQITSDRNITTILVTHFLDEAIKLSDRVLLLSALSRNIVHQFAIVEPLDLRSTEVIRSYEANIYSRFRELAETYDSII